MNAGISRKWPRSRPTLSSIARPMHHSSRPSLSAGYHALRGCDRKPQGTDGGPSWLVAAALLVWRSCEQVDHNAQCLSKLIERALPDDRGHPIIGKGAFNE